MKYRDLRDFVDQLAQEKEHRGKFPFLLFAGFQIVEVQEVIQQGENQGIIGRAQEANNKAHDDHDGGAPAGASAAFAAPVRCAAAVAAHA